MAEPDIEALRTGVDERGVPWPLRCALFWPGHNVHWIPGLRVANGRAEPSWHGRVVEHDGVWLTIEAERGTRRRYAHHDPERLAAALRLCDGWVDVNDQYPMLAASGYYFGITERAIEPCDG